MEIQGIRTFICNNVSSATLIDIGHTSNMFELTFLEIDKFYAYPLVFQFGCPFRLCQNGEVILTDNDFFYPVDESTEFSLENASRFDAIVAKLKAQNSSLTVKNIDITPTGDLSMELRSPKSTFFFECFNNATEDRESWRFFVDCCDFAPIVFYRNGRNSDATATELDTEVISCCHVVDEHAPILYISHDKDDGMWQFLCGKEHEASEGRVISLEEALMLDSTLPKIQKIKQGYIAERISRETPWKIKRHP